MLTLNVITVFITFSALAMYAWILTPIMTKDHKPDISTKIYAVIIGILLIVLAGLSVANTNEFDKYIHTQPTAMDVYSGKTELRYTVQGGEKIDSVVVYKNTIKQ